MNIPTSPFSLMKKVYKQVFPIVHEHLAEWKKKAEAIPNEELRSQALASIESKAFHCEGGSILAILAGPKMKECIEFIVAYQTISDYLDNLCDRSTSLDPADFRMLHQSMPDALTCGAELKNYYAFREDQDDEGYLHDLVQTCQRLLFQIKEYPDIKESMLELSGYYCDLQVHKHVKKDERVPRLETWFERHRSTLPEMEWYEFSACSGSTLGIFCLAAYGFQSSFDKKLAQQIRDSYFPYVQGLHILLDYLIDQEEDQAGGDLNFCSYYPTEESMMQRLKHFIEKADSSLKGIPHEGFHRLINRGLLGVYLSDQKVTSRKELNRLARALLKRGGGTSLFFYLNGRAYRTYQRLTAQ
ncbi:DUF2600 family protein [Bacillus mangrovi]|uniref:DUF2600 family protein n=1 Tax=Metabacillus mangrovi TaxID=1491830 RepID=A0A7X2V5W1_9BACI|nr:tetraprenyl-beta-curcumene synthase family protein [Metabacillus mangrovi]MTH54478.1 DUF2600 family protein [Metabacillus mangrovi]